MSALLRRLTTLFALLCAASAQAGNFTLVYHEVGQGQHGTLGILPADLEERINTLQGLGYQFITSSQIRQNSGKTAVLEFDDGFESVYTQAFPVLRRLGVPGTVYPILNLVGQPGHMTQAQLDELRAAGWEVGSHTRNHADLTSLTPGSIRAELSPTGIKDAEKVCVAYPFSLFDTRVRRLAKDVYGCGVGGGQGNWGGPYSLPGPQITPWDGWILPYRAPLGLDGRTPLFAAGLGLLAHDALQDKPAGSTPPRFWNPARYEMLGRGDYQVNVQGSRRDSLFAQRQGNWIYNIMGGKDYAEAGVTYHPRRGPLSYGVGYGSSGAVLGVSAALGGYGEGWLRYLPAANTGQFAAGLEAVPLDYLKLKAEYDSQKGAALEAVYALPLNVGEGHPYRVLAGHSREQGWYGGALWQLGSYSLRASIGKSFGVGFESRW